MIPHSLHAPNPEEHSPFPILVLDVQNGVSTPPRLGFKKMHWHADLQFIVITAGVAHIDCAGLHFACSTGQAALFNSGIPHRITSSHEAKYTSFVFPAKILGFFPGSEMATFSVNPYVGVHAQPVMFFDGSEPWHAKVISNLMDMHSLLVGHTSSNAERYHACVRLLDAWAHYIGSVDQQLPGKHTREANGRIKAFTSFIDENFSSPISLEDIAHAGNVSKAECARCFKKLLQTTPYAYLLNYRIDKATELMRDGELNATAIAHAVGFSSSSHFSTVFKKALGMTPSAYMAALNSDGATSANA